MSADEIATRNHGDLLVVGGGPAGAAASITAARAGLKVTLIDKARFPRDKCCGDALTTLALRQLNKLNFDPSSVASWFNIDSAWLHSSSGRQVQIPLPTHGLFAAVTPRLELDNALINLARSVGVTVLENCGFLTLTNHLDHVLVSVNDNDQLVDLTSSWVIAADGMWSPVRKALSLSESGYLGEWHAFRQYASNVTGPARSRLNIWFDEDLLPGYAWSFPLPNNRVNIGFCMWRDGQRRTQDMKDIWTDLLQRPHVVEALGKNFVLQGRHLAWPIPARIDQAITGSGRVLFVGDAAMATDALTGEGIGQALLTGSQAAQAIITGGSPQDVRLRYRRSVRKHLFADHRMSLRMSKILSYPRGARAAIALLDHAGNWGRCHFGRWMFEDEPRAIALTPSRWHRRLLRQSGSYFADN